MTNNITLEIDVDRITVEQFLEMLDIQERMGDEPKAADIRDLFDVLRNAVVGQDVMSLPYRYLRIVMEQVTAAFSAGIDPN
jgi:hypothetical protein